MMMTITQIIIRTSGSSSRVAVSSPWILALLFLSSQASRDSNSSIVSSSESPARRFCSRSPASFIYCLQPLLLPVTMLISMAVAALSCLLPIKRAVAIDPAVVLKGE